MELKIPFTKSSLVFGSQKVLTECQKCGVPTRHKCIRVVGNLSKWRCESCSTVYVSLTAKCSECSNEELGMVEDRDAWFKFECGTCSEVAYFYVFDCASCKRTTLHEDYRMKWRCADCNALCKMRDEHFAEISRDNSDRLEADLAQAAADALERQG